MRPLGIRWTIGDVSPEGFEVLRLSIAGAYNLFGKTARYAVCVNTVPLAAARARVGDVPTSVEWHAVGRDDIPSFLRERFDAALGEGAGWKLAPLRLFPDAHELALDNDCVLWALPDGLRDWLAGDGCAIAEDVAACFGHFARLAGTAPRNAGIRGLPPRFDLEAAFRRTLAEVAVTLSSELDEQGMQVATVVAQPHHVVTLDAVTICSPFPPHLPGLGTAGAHFVGLNAKRLPWSFDGRPAHEVTRDNWTRLRPTVYQRVGIELE